MVKARRSQVSGEDREGRKAEYTPKMMREMRDRLNATGRKLELLAAQLEKEGISSVPADGASKFDRGMRLVDTLVVGMRFGYERAAMAV